MNEDLKKIKQHAYVLGGDEPETIGQQSAGIIIACAERMAADITSYEIGYTGKCAEIEELNSEIARLKAELEKFQLVATGCNDEANINQIILMVNRAIGEGREGEGSDLYWAQCWCLLREIKHLKKKPDVVRCGECENLVINDDAKYCGICLDAKRKRNDFCSRGQRRESEEGK